MKQDVFKRFGQRVTTQSEEAWEQCCNNKIPVWVEQTCIENSYLLWKGRGKGGYLYLSWSGAVPRRHRVPRAWKRGRLNEKWGKV